MVDAARELFISEGYDATSLTSVVQRSGGSLATLYKLFGNKEGLLLAIVVDDPQRPDFVKEISTLAEVGRPPATILRDIGLQLASRLAEPGFVALLRVLIGQSLRDQEWAKRLDAIVGKPAEDTLAASFECWQRNGIVGARHDARELAGAFLSLIIYPFEALAIRGRAVGTERDAIKRNIERFVAGCFVDPPSSNVCNVELGPKS